MIYVQIDGSSVINRAVFEEEMPNDWPDRESWFANEEAQIGWSYQNGEFSAPAVAVRVPTISNYQIAIQSLIDTTALTKQFNDGVTLASYKDSTNPVWAAQAGTFIAWRDNVWQHAYSELAKVQAGEREQPTIEAFLLELPEMVWPA
ncbi:hypothetical protein [Rhizobium sp. BK251]|uniref:hypothetical protein n=1 Tax=Rhizobium sp. BK251 TaxID=2512125 RepID=UPI0010499F6C|nr:hypothetical protein [Rhizobium sp. BK251]TCL70529.1 hypothetical protein EV286_107404 [Rhizobium sp. BK251]